VILILYLKPALGTTKESCFVIDPMTSEWSPNQTGNHFQFIPRQGPAPFVTRVDPKEKLGLNPVKKAIPIVRKKKGILNSSNSYS
jgi:hypothetical protein